MTRALTCSLLAFLALAHIAVVGMLSQQEGALGMKEYEDELFVLPSSILRVASLDYKGIVSDFLFIKGIVYIGGSIQKGHPEKISFTESQWHALYRILEVSTDLDPYFQDPYYLANAYLTWDAGMIRETNSFLEKGSKYRNWDWSLPFFSGFNYFFFLNENDNASEWLMKASRRPGASPTIASLASKMAFKASRTEISISFLEEMIKQTDDESMKKLFEERVEAYKAILELEKAVDAYRQKFGEKPSTLEGLVKKGIIAEIPEDPYGGKFSIDADGKVRTTSENRLVPFHKK